ncbi:MAG: hypothetical protein P1V21_17970 [Rhizobiaceae bacterium]|nr:hypothetical protein [Rhizobiaceae bacterium]
MKRQTVKVRNYLDGLALGALVSTLLFLVLFMVLDFHLDDDKWVSLLGNIVVALFSSGAALIALRGIRLQVSQAAKREEDRRERSLAAARAMLPATLSELCQIALNNMRLRFETGGEPIGIDLPPPTDFHPLPDHVIPILKDVIQHADPISQERLSNILRHFQVLQARRVGADISTIAPNNGDVSSVPDHNAISDAMSWAVVYSLVADAFGYARGSQSSIPESVNADRVREAFIHGGVVLESYPNVENILNIRSAEGRLDIDWTHE